MKTAIATDALSDDHSPRADITTIVDVSISDTLDIPFYRRGAGNAKGIQKIPPTSFLRRTEETNRMNTVDQRRKDWSRGLSDLEGLESGSHWRPDMGARAIADLDRMSERARSRDGKEGDRLSMRRF